MGKEQKIRMKLLKDIRNWRQTQIVNEINDKKRQGGFNHTMDNELFNKGRDWFNSGFTLKDAPEDMKNNIDFKLGFQKGQRVKMVNELLYNTGVEYFNKGLTLEDAPKNYKDNEYFIRGYEDAGNKIKHK